MTTPPHRPPPELVGIEDLFADPQFTNPSISPDGTRIAYLAPHRAAQRAGPGRRRHPPRHPLDLEARPGAATAATGRHRPR